MYYKVYSRHNNRWDPYCVLELSKAELKRRRRDYPRQLHLAITGAEAHRWVRCGGIHGTGLYIDQDKRIRRSS
jgi:hypothetical protein